MIIKLKKNTLYGIMLIYLINFLLVKFIICKIFILFYLIIIPGFLIYAYLFDNEYCDFNYILVVSSFYGILYLCISGLISYIIFNYSSISLIILSILPNLFLNKNNDVKIVIKEKITMLLMSTSIICYIFYGSASLFSKYPLGFDTFRLHTIYINYLLNNGKLIIGDVINKTLFNPSAYQWGFHVYLSFLAMIANINTFDILKLLPQIISILYPFYIYNLSEKFCVYDHERIISFIICPFILYHPSMHGLIYPFPSSLAFILFIYFMYIIFNNQSILYKISYLIIFFFIHKGLFLICTLMLLIFSLKTLKPIFLKYKEHLFKINKYILYINTIILSFFFIFMLELYHAFLDNREMIFFIDYPYFLNLNNISGKIIYYIFIISLIYNIKNIKLNSIFNGYCIILSIFIISSGVFIPYRWLLFSIPFVIFFNSYILGKIIMLPKNLNNKLIIVMIIVLIYSIEPSINYINRPFNLGLTFTEEELSAFNTVKNVDDNMTIFTNYKINRLFNGYAIYKNILNKNPDKYYYEMDFIYDEYIKDPKKICNFYNISNYYILVPFKKLPNNYVLNCTYDPLDYVLLNYNKVGIYEEIL